MIPHIRKKVIEAAALTVPVAVVEMSRHADLLSAMPGWFHTAWPYAAAVLTTLVVFKPGLPLLEKGRVSFARRKLNMFSLIAPGILITYVYSLLALLAPSIFPDSFRMHGSVPVYFEAAAMITTLVLLGQFLEGRAESHTGDALTSLSAMIPAHACVVKDGQELETPVDALQVGQQIRLRPDDRIPVDGTVVSGEATVDESMLTGEPVPVAKKEDNTVTGGTLVQDGTLLVRVDKIGGETVLAGIIKMVESAQESSAPIQRIADRVTGKLVPAVMLVAVVTLVIWWVFGPAPALWFGMLHAITVLMVTCPCALGLATPLSIVTGMGRGAQSGILIKDAQHLEKLAGARHVILDKTGTLTKGKPEVHHIATTGSLDKDRLLQLAASVEHYSRHPLAGAVTAKAGEQGLALTEAENFSSESGNGVSARINGQLVRVGKKTWLLDQGVEQPDAAFDGDAEISGGSTAAWVSVDERIAGVIYIADQLKPDTVDAVRCLKQMGLKVALLTGDSQESAEAIARQVGIEIIHANVLPGDKASTVKSIASGGETTLMVGDGINDAPALATADVGIAMGTGTETARASGHIIIVDDSMATLVAAIRLSRAVMRNIKQNLFFAFAYNFVMIPVAAGVLYPSTGLMLTPVLASAAMSASCLTVIGNSLRLRKLPLDA